MITTVVSRSPAIRVLDGALSQKECFDLILLAGRSMVRAGVYRDGEIESDEEYRSCDVAFIDVGEKAAAPLVEIARRFSFAGPDMIESVQVARYGVGGEYKVHHDALFHEGGGQRVLSVLAYLSAPRAGGTTTFPEAGVRIDPVDGRAVVWGNLGPDGKPDPRLVHSGDPVEDGEKWIASLWVRDSRIDSGGDPL